MIVGNQQWPNRGCTCRWSFRAASVLATIVALITCAATADEPPSSPAIGDAEKAGDEAPAEEAASHVPARPRGKKKQLRDAGKMRLRYAGRSFEDWRDQLINDLDPETRKQAMEPIATFGKNGYAGEAVAALAQTLHDDRADVAQTTAQALSQIGAPAMATLVEGLADRRPSVRKISAQALGMLGIDVKSATASLLKLLSDPDNDVRYATIAALVAVAGTDDALKKTFERITASDDFADRSAFLEGLTMAPPRGGWLLRLLVRLAEDDNPRIRSQVAQLLVRSGPPEQEVVDALKELVRDGDQQVWQPTMNSLMNTFDNKATRALVLADILLSREVFERLQQSVPMESAIDTLASARDQTAITVPVLAEVVGMNLHINSIEDSVRAMQALGRLGPAAKAAIPVLKGWANGERQIENVDNEMLRKQALRALVKILGPDHEPPVDGNGK